jgi:hypothetical protein
VGPRLLQATELLPFSKLRQKGTLWDYARMLSVASNIKGASSPSVVCFNLEPFPGFTDIIYQNIATS